MDSMWLRRAVSRLTLALTVMALAGLAALAGCAVTPGGAGSQTPGATGVVTVSADQTTYTVGQAIGVSVHNGLGAPIYALDTRSGCTILELQVEQQGQWTIANAARCPLGRPARLVMVASGQTYTARIMASQFGPASQALAPGTYRLQLFYQLSSQVAASGTGATVYSSTFTISGNAS